MYVNTTQTGGHTVATFHSLLVFAASPKSFNVEKKLRTNSLEGRRSVFEHLGGLVKVGSHQPA
jgi:hypothetical protein